MVGRFTAAAALHRVHREVLFELRHSKRPTQAALDLPQVQASFRHSEPVAFLCSSPIGESFCRQGSHRTPDIQRVAGAGQGLWLGDDLRAEEPDRVHGSRPLRRGHDSPDLGRGHALAQAAGFTPATPPAHGLRKVGLRATSQADITRGCGRCPCQADARGVSDRMSTNRGDP